ncbi:MAG: hypothetical protein HUN05_11265 [Desulfobacter sp.]|nr:MAG: hypothetical protein HUN05_11265 [Desulfobacter sp.]
MKKAGQRGERFCLPCVCLYKHLIKIVLAKSKRSEIQPNKVIHGYGVDGYFIGKNIYKECVSNDVKIIKHLQMTDSGKFEFVFENIDRRRICIGIKAG